MQQSPLGRQPQREGGRYQILLSGGEKNASRSGQKRGNELKDWKGGASSNLKGEKEGQITIHTQQQWKEE